jgi:hypothetical protein
MCRGSMTVFRLVPITSLLDVDGQRHDPAALPPRMTRYHCTGALVGVRTGLDRSRKCRHYRDSISGPPISYLVAIPTTLSRPTTKQVCFLPLKSPFKLVLFQISSPGLNEAYHTEVKFDFLYFLGKTIL